MNLNVALASTPGSSVTEKPAVAGCSPWMPANSQRRGSALPPVRARGRLTFFDLHAGLVDADAHGGRAAAGDHP